MVNLIRPRPFPPIVRTWKPLFVFLLSYIGSLHILENLIEMGAVFCAQHHTA